MIISFKQIGAAVVLAICGASMSGVIAQQPARPPQRVIHFNGEMTMLLAAMTNTYGVTIGVELDSQRYHQVSLHLEDPTVTDVMNAMVQSSKKFQWRQNGDFIDVWPLAGGNPLLETRISSFNVKNLSPSEALDQLFDLPEVQANMAALNLNRRAPEGPPVKLSSAKFSVNLEGVSLREALDKVAQESHLEIWIFRTYPNGFFSISSIQR